jgi:hypothetical protein
MSTEHPQDSPPVPAPSTEPPAVDPKFDDPPDAEPTPEPAQEPSDPHTPPLDDIEDAKYLDEDDPRRKEVEAFKEAPPSSEV